ncbi:LCP family protein [Streptomyces sp. NPDC089919]|uniref:LCP family protein n=1 Tax=Streptomyces sp. NPDC089919 TaxID=3155188 RepID=UPI003416DE67
MRKATVSLALLAAVVTATPVLAAQARPARAPGTDRGTNILVVGIDSRAGLSRAEINRLHVGGKGCNCTDVMMLVHLSADERRASVVSVPRDSLVEYATGTTPAPQGKINGAFAAGGRELTVRTVEKVTGLHVDHYLQTDFAGFEKAVDALGGATICADKPMKDENSGLDIAPGVHDTDGRNSLYYVRARHVSAHPGDLGRVRRQQRFVANLLGRLRAQGALAGPLSTARTARALLRSVRTDPGTTLEDLVRIGWALGSLRPEQTEFVTVPMSEFDRRVPGVGSTLVWHQSRSDALWAALAADRPVTGDPRITADDAAPAQPSAIRVRADEPAVAAALRAGGFPVTATPAPTSRPAGPPVIRYAPGAEEGASTLAAALPGARLVPVAGHDDGFDVAVGAAPVQVRKVVYDRNVVEGAPVPGSRLACPGM